MVAGAAVALPSSRPCLAFFAPLSRLLHAPAWPFLLLHHRQFAYFFSVTQHECRPSSTSFADDYAKLEFSRAVFVFNMSDKAGGQSVYTVFIRR